MKNRNRIDSIYKEGLGDFAKAPPQLVWDNLEERLQKSNVKQSKGKWKFLALFLVFVFATSLFFAIEYFSTPDTPNSNSSRNKTIVDQTSKVNLSDHKELKSRTSIEELKSSEKTALISSEISIKSTDAKSINGEALNPKMKLDNKKIGNRDNKKSENQINVNTYVSINEELQMVNNHDSNDFEKSDLSSSSKRNINNDLSTINSVSSNVTIAIEKVESRSQLNLLEVNNRNIDFDLKVLIEPIKPIIKKKYFTFNLEKSFWGSGFRVLKDNGQLTEENVEYFNSVERKSSSSNISFSASFQLPLFTIETGIDYYRNSIRGTQEFFMTYMPDDFNTVLYTTSLNTNSFNILSKNLNGVSTGDLVVLNNEVEQSQIGLSIPVFLNKSFSMGLFKISAGIGANINIPLSKQIRIIQDENIDKILEFKVEYEEENIRSFIGYAGKLRVSYPLYKNFYLTSGIVHNRSLTSANRNKLVNYYPKSTRVFIGIQTDL